MPDRSFNASATSDDLSLFGGGPFYQLQVLLHLIRVPKWDLPRRIICSLAVCWLPLVIITAFIRREELPALLKDYLVYSRVVVSIPVLLTGHLLMEDRFRVIAKHVREAHLLRDEGRRQLNDVIATLVRVRDSALPELLILILVFADLLVIGPGRLAAGSAWAASTDGNPHLTAAGWYYLLVSVSTYQFLILLSLLKWMAWSFFLYKLSRMDLKLVATHSDLHGGLGFLGLAPTAFIPTAIAVSTPIGGVWRQQILHEDVRLSSFFLPAVILVGLIFMFELVPLCFFVPKLETLRQRAKLEYGILAQTRAIDFHERWILHQHRQEEQLFVPGVTMLTDLATSYSNIKRMQPLPVDKITLIGLALAVLIPLFPAVLAEIPLSVILKAFFQAVKAAPI
ncbi:MAG: hypothetical protein C5B58_10600 [Acidobacteria bacterium]|nr:MAG: hypothetical protein C5B58_10600 [Acidobacteriota bacterium]